MALPKNKEITVAEMLANVTEYNFIITDGTSTIDTEKFNYCIEIGPSALTGASNRQIKYVIFIKAEKPNDVANLGTDTNKILGTETIVSAVSGSSAQTGNLDIQMKVKSKRNFLLTGNIMKKLS